jgi:hypothetical protein
VSAAPAAALALLALAASVAAGAEPAPPRLAFDLRAKHRDALRAERAADLARARPLASGDAVPATLDFEGRAIPVELRLDGEYPDSSHADKWPLRVEVHGGDAVLGMRRFSLLAPAARADQAEALVLRHLRREDVLAARTRFVEVSLAGRAQGLMLLEEHFSKELPESQRRREGVIFHLEPDAALAKEPAATAADLFRGLFEAGFDAQRSGHVEKSPELRAGYETARGLLRAFLAGELPARQVFDLEATARFLAVAELWRAAKLLDWRRLRLYFDPVSQRIEPVGHAADLRPPLLDAGLVTRSSALPLVLLEDPELRARFLAELHRIARELLAPGGRDWLGEEEALQLPALRSEDPEHPPFDAGPLVARAGELAALDAAAWARSGPRAPGAETAYPEPVRTVQRGGAGQAELGLWNQLPRPLRLVGLELVDPTSAWRVALAPGDALPAALPPASPEGTPGRRQLRLDLPPDAPAEVRIAGRVAGDGAGESAFRALAIAPGLAANPVPVATLEQVLRRHPFLAWDAERRMLRAKAGSWRVDGALVLPEGVGLELAAGTRLRFAPEGFLLATGPLRFRGSAEHPVALEGVPGDAGPGPWQGVAVLHSQRPHAWEHVRVRGTTGVARGPWQLPAGVTLRRSQLRMTDVEIRGNRCEDALNLIRSRFRLEDLSIRDASSDALDADFSDGEVIGGRFSGVGGDGIDVSGARVHVEGTRFDDVRDKAISVGEGSRLAARGLRIERVGTALASKDASSATLEESRISDVEHVALMAYVKKREYGPGELRAKELHLDGVPRLAVAQTGSRVVIDGVEQPPQALDVEAIYQHGYMQK